MSLSLPTFSSHVLSLLDKNFLQLPQSFLVAFSGGLDSMVLLHLLNQWRNQNDSISVRAMHINHQLQTVSDAWEIRCINYCKQNAIEHISVKVNIDSTGQGIEAAAREARYRAFAENLNSNEILLTAHHQDDQVETLMLRLLRGCGVEGAAAMREIKSFAHGILMRPLLSFGRRDLHDYALANNLSWVDDPSNTDNRYDRNFLRNEVFPLLETRWPAYRATLQRFSRNAEENNVLLHHYVEKDYLTCLEIKNLDIQALKKYSLEQQKQILRMWIRESGFEAPTEKQLLQLFNLLAAKDDAMPLVYWSGVEVRRYQQRLYIMHKLPEFDKHAALTWDTANELYISGIGTLVCKKLAEGVIFPKVVVKFRQGGEACQIPGRQGHHSLKNLMQENQIPPWLRDRTPIIYRSNEILAIPGIFTADKNTLFLLQRE